MRTWPITIFVFSLPLVIHSCKWGHSYQYQACRMEQEVVLATTRRVPSAVSVKSLTNGSFIAAWSTDDATWFKWLDPHGKEMSHAIRVQRTTLQWNHKTPLKEKQTADDTAPPKTFWTGVDRPSIRSEDLDLAATQQGGFVLAMLERRGRGRQGGAFSLISKGKDDQHPSLIYLGPAGEYATRISIVNANNQSLIAWHEGMLSSSDIRLARIDLTDSKIQKSRTIREQRPLSSPTLVSMNGKTVIAWAETTRSGKEPTASVKTAAINENLDLEDRFVVAQSRFMEPSPSMTVVENGIGITFRDDKDKDDTPEYHFSLLDSQGRPVSGPARVSKADGLHGPALTTVNGIVMGAAVRSFQRNLLVGLNRLNREGAKLGGEFQLYADKTDFVRVDIDANKQITLMVYAEDRRSAGRVLAARVTCLEKKQGN